MVSISDWIQAARPKTLGAAVAAVVVGSAVGWKTGSGIEFHWGLFLATLGSCMALQIATNWFNDVLDFMKGSDTAARVGPRRITASGLVSPAAVIRAALAMLAVAALLAVPLFLARGWPIVAIGIPSLFFCFGYTGGPFPLAHRGLGELFVLIFFGWIAVTGSAFVQSGLWPMQSLVAGTQIGLLSTALIAINNLRDVEEDGRTGKKTLAVRLGAAFARGEIALLLTLPHALGGYWLAHGWRLAFWLPLLTLPLGFLLIRLIRAHPPGPVYNRFLALSGMHLLAFAALLTLGIARS